MLRKVVGYNLQTIAGGGQKHVYVFLCEKNEDLQDAIRGK